ncbi:MAG: hypothetical protein COT38_01125 [Candidatus Omnitrophica bacterium CG08_land_8_20_14_0_20_41_16]|nr:MAG: hypothetical protein COT38_01125 [Candidatus Omnitrophica bacterium CG08_land_8_20_14_0_20_41_16]
MKTNLKSFVSVLIIANFIFTPLLYALDEAMLSSGKEPVISMDLQDASLKDVLKILSIQSNLNFVASGALEDRKVTLYMEKAPLKEAMDKIFKANNLTYDLDRDASIFIVKDLGKPEVETITEVFYFKYATVSSSSLKEEMKNNKSSTTNTTSSGSSSGSSSGNSSSGTSSSDNTGKWKVEDDSGITQSIKKLLSKDGSVIEDFRTNSLIVTDIPSRMEVIRKVIASLDIPMPQVLLEVEMLDVSRDTVDALGVKFSGSVLTATLSGTPTATLGFPFNSWGKVFLPATGGSLAVGSSLAAQIDWLRTQTDTRYLARPKILTLNNETAEIAITKDEIMTLTKEWHDPTATAAGYYTYTIERATGLSGGLTKEGIGISLRVTPQINEETGEITMFIYPKSSSATQSTYITDQVALDPEIRSTKSVVRVKDGETVVLGGLIHNEKSVIITKLPILGDLPLLGAFFRHKNQTKDKERELLVFITPHIIKDSGVIDKKIEPAQPAKKIMPMLREQSTASVIGRQSSINTYLNTLEKQR